MKSLTKEQKIEVEKQFKNSSVGKERLKTTELNEQIKKSKQETISKFVELINSIPADRLGDVDFNITEYELATRVTIDVEMNKFKS